MKKITTILLLCALCVMLSPCLTVSADTYLETPPSIEEIFSNYIEKSFGALQYGANGASLCSLDANTKTLEQETVEELANAGYLAFNITSLNYNDVAQEMNTDLSSLGLSSDYSYIIAISGDGGNGVTTTSAVGGSDIVQRPGDTDGSSAFRYTSNGITYTMRTVTITSQDDPYLVKITPQIHFGEIRQKTDYAGDLLLALGSLGVDAVSNGFPTSTCISLFSNWVFTEESYEVVNDSAITLFAGTTWIKSYIQVWDSVRSVWITSQCSSYAEASAKVSGMVFEKDLRDFREVETGMKKTTFHSTNYQDFSSRCEIALIGFSEERIYCDFPLNISYNLYDEDKVSIMPYGVDFLLHLEPVYASFPQYEWE